MRKWLVFLLAVCLLLMPTLAHAQNSVTIRKLNIQLWPEYDRPDMLVMYSFALSEDTTLPAELQVRIPANANLNAVAKNEGEKMVNVPYDAPVKDGDWITITMLIDDLANYRVEYYLPMAKSGTTRNFSFVWQSDYDVESLRLQFQQPPTSTNLSATPELPTVDSTAGGIIYHNLTLSGLPAGEVFTLELSYDKDNDDLTVSAMPVEIEGAQESGGGSFSLTDSLPSILVGIGVVLIVGGLLYFTLSGRNSIDSTPRKRHKPRAASAGGNVYCHECGKRARSGDKFCRSCGARLRSQ
ncbi:MAG: hypothetical protein B5M51_05215 [Anaerolinea sp. 4484_236]|nr:MAG: hypothetical protein B5M51_05215 [Anaerolinea sp. 4484_236]